MTQTPPEYGINTPRVALRLVPSVSEDSANPMAALSTHRRGTDVRGFSLTSGILFATDSDDLDTAATVNLDRLAAFLGKYRARTGLIEGYTDNAGVDFGNQDLSLRRAESVRSYLVAHGVDASRLVSVGRGACYPAASNESVVGRQQNRRVEVLISNDQGSRNRAANGLLDPVSGTQQLDMRR